MKYEDAVLLIRQ